MTEQNLVFYYLEADTLGILRVQDIKRPANRGQLRASVVPPNPSRNLEAKIGSQRYETQSIQNDPQTTRDSLNSWDEVNLNSIQGVCVDERVATSTSSVSRIEEPAISHPPQAGGYPELFLHREYAMPKAASKLAAAPSTPPARAHFRRFLYPLKVQRLQWQSLVMEDQKWEK